MKVSEIRRLWQKYDDRDVLTDEEVTTLLRSAENGLEFCCERGAKLVSYGIIADIETLNSWQRARRKRCGQFGSTP